MRLNIRFMSILLLALGATGCATKFEEPPVGVPSATLKISSISDITVTQGDCGVGNLVYSKKCKTSTFEKETVRVPAGKKLHLQYLGYLGEARRRKYTCHATETLVPEANRTYVVMGMARNFAQPTFTDFDPARREKWLAGHKCRLLVQ